MITLIISHQPVLSLADSAGGRISSPFPARAQIHPTERDVRAICAPCRLSDGERSRGNVIREDAPENPLAYSPWTVPAWRPF